MSCFHPLHMFTVGTHKNKYGKIVNTNIVKSADVEFVRLENGLCIDNYTEIPCGKCIGCRLEYSRQWANRCLLEMQSHDHSLFLTLTYDEEHLPTKCFSRLDSGETDMFSHSLSKRHIQLFMKRLRKYLETNNKPKVRYFICGEYGGQTFRPHYHAIIFGLQLDDMVFYKKNQKGFNMYNSETLDKIWQNGYVVIEDCTWETCAYTARYIMKKQIGDASDCYEYNELEPPFLLMSRNPGIGRDYFDNNSFDFIRSDFISVPTDSGGYSFTPSRYYRNLLRDTVPYFYDDRRKVFEDCAADVRKVKEMMYSDEFLKSLESEEQNLIARTKSLHRDLV